MGEDETLKLYITISQKKPMHTALVYSGNFHETKTKYFESGNFGQIPSSTAGCT